MLQAEAAVEATTNQPLNGLKLIVTSSLEYVDEHPHSSQVRFFAFLLCLLTVGLEFRKATLSCRLASAEFPLLHFDNEAL